MLYIHECIHFREYMYNVVLKKEWGGGGGGVLVGRYMYKLL